MSDELKPCPFCGAEGYIDEIESTLSHKKIVYYPRCRTEKCPGNQGWVHYETKAEAIAAWNLRPSPWIAVEDGLPKSTGKYLTVRTNASGKQYSTIKNYYSCEKKFGEFCKTDPWITHWQPITLPQVKV